MTNWPSSGAKPDGEPSGFETVFVDVYLYMNSRPWPFSLFQLLP